MVYTVDRKLSTLGRVDSRPYYIYHRIGIVTIDSSMLPIVVTRIYTRERAMPAYRRCKFCFTLLIHLWSDFQV